ncbi:MAG: hypothetical protein WBD31_03985 [Rubripirellula sp.]
MYIIGFTVAITGTFPQWSEHFIAIASFVNLVTFVCSSLALHTLVELPKVDFRVGGRTDGFDFDRNVSAVLGPQVGVQRVQGILA